jgi:hypothetical protein
MSRIRSNQPSSLVEATVVARRDQQSLPVPLAHTADRGGCLAPAQPSRGSTVHDVLRRGNGHGIPSSRGVRTHEYRSHRHRLDQRPAPIIARNLETIADRIAIAQRRDAAPAAIDGALAWLTSTVADHPALQESEDRGLQAELLTLIRRIAPGRL